MSSTLVACGFGQVPRDTTPGFDRFQAVGRQTAQLTLHLELDRAEYLRSERMRATLTIVNPTDGPLEVFDPFRLRHDAIDLQYKNDPARAAQWGDWESRTHRVPHASSPPWNMMDGKPTIVFQSGEQRVVDLDLGTEGKGPIRHQTFRTDLLRPGEYRLVFWYGRGAFAPFRILKTTPLPVHAVKRLANRLAPGGQEHPNYGGVAAALEAEGRTYIVLTVAGFDPMSLFDRRYSTDDGTLGTLFGCVRAGVSGEPVTAIELQNYGDRLEVSWTAQSGRIARRMMDIRTQRVVE